MINVLEIRATALVKLAATVYIQGESGSRDHRSDEPNSEQGNPENWSRELVIYYIVYGRRRMHGNVVTALSGTRESGDNRL
jgi:hypothetical protein